MLTKLKKKIKGQSTAEYAILIALVIGAIVGMQVYVQRAISAGIKGKTDDMSAAMGGTSQYEPYYTESEYEQYRNSETGAYYGYNRFSAKTDTFTQRKKGGYTRTINAASF